MKNCDYWQENGHTARCSHKFHIKCQNVKCIISTIFTTYHIFPYFSALKTAALKKPVSILKPAITGSYLIVPKNSRVLKIMLLYCFGYRHFSVLYMSDQFNVKNRNEI